MAGADKKFLKELKEKEFSLAYELQCIKTQIRYVIDNCTHPNTREEFIHYSGFLYKQVIRCEHCEVKLQ